MLQDRAGYMLVCTEHGLFAYDGRRFLNLGVEQGLRDGGVVYGLGLTSTGRVAVEYADEVFVSDHRSDASHPPSSLAFRSVLHPGVALYDKRPHRLAAWQDGMVVLAGDTTERIVIPNAGSPHIETMGYDLEEQRILNSATAVFSIAGHLWEAFDDGRLCAAEPGAVKCYGAADGLRSGPWVDLIAGSGGRLFARSASSVATFDPASNRWSVVELPDQGGQYENYPSNLVLFRTPDGDLATQANHGLAIHGHGGWRALTVEDGAPSGAVMSAVTDGTGQFWLQILGRGLVRWVGYGRWEALQTVDGLSKGIPWQSVRLPGASLWVATDTGIDEVVRRGSSLRVGRVFPGSSFALAVDPNGDLWSSSGMDGAKVINPANGSVNKIEVPPVDTIVPDPNGFVWIGTEAGLFRADDHPDLRVHPVLEGATHTPVPAVVLDGSGGVFYLAGGRLRHRHPDGADVAVAGAWPGGGFGPVALAIGRDGGLWIGGPGGLFCFFLANDRVASYRAVPVSDTNTNAIAAVMVDHRGWIWAGTALGVSVFDGQRWVSVNADGGLLSDDVDQGGIREDPDGSVWIATTAGFSHLLDPAWLFNDRPLDVVVSRAVIGSQPVVGRRIPYTEQALSIQLGTPNYGSERSVVFRYRLSGVDAGWVESSTGAVRYPFVPPGQHVLTVVGYDEMTHRSSNPATLVVDVGFPWWRQWWSEAAWALITAGLVYGAICIRLHAVLARQAELKRHVAAATGQLQYQAAHDQLTGLLNRCEIERRLAAKLAGGAVGKEMVVALVDVDHFKRVNDSHGHLGGDDVLRAMGRLVSRTIQEGEYAGRYGGEEILLVLDDSYGRAAERVLNLHLAIRHDTFNAAGSPIHVTCSIGVAWAVPGDNWESLIGRADEALYEAKEGGRDRVAESRLVRPNASGVAVSGSRPKAS